MAKTEKLRALACIHYNGGVYCPGTDEETFDCDLAEAKRLKADGLARPVRAEEDAEKKRAAELKEKEELAAQAELQAQAELLAKIAAAETEEALAALMPEEEPADAEFAAKLTAAAEARLAELKG